MSQLSQLEHRIHTEIPLSRHLGVRLTEFDGDALVVTAPLASNVNHQGTGFGGSLYSVGVVAAWGLVDLWLENAGLAGNVVVQQAGIEYTAPVDEDFFAVARAATEKELERFLATVARHGKGRLTVTAQLYTGMPGRQPAGLAKAVLQGQFVVRDARSLTQ
ncbi:YiiD C-terminal domain-containing protein [Marinobacter xestospongiae]|uniref:YiiD C-terminal domain-containing protein n=1 Tax=Marinobacter xestospongiae TaxID=994319 RepID=A0ABU3VYE1_9GAMM|nr:YiiD C-terminal domain-containing protein [Marinobacter xestospongiae]MDV2079269.1 YiiD C-terminal domain-containing protein [Marinobacter xestospongiae]